MNNFDDANLREALQEQMGEEFAPASLGLLPRVFRLISIGRERDGERRTRCTATIFHEKAALRVCWVTGNPDAGLKPGALVSPRWFGASSYENGAIRISHLVLLERPDTWENLFLTIPHGWVKDRGLIARAAKLADALPRPYRHLLNALFWDGGRFRRFCTLQSSAYGHHSEVNGSLRHAVEVAERMRDHCKATGKGSAALCILAGLLHDAGKADEYRLSPDGGWVPTERGKLVWHKATIIEWVAEANARWNLNLPEKNYMALLHCLLSSAHAPDWLGIRKPSTPEAALLSGMEQPSGLEELMRRTAPGGAGWGLYHAHLNGRPCHAGSARPD